MHKLKLKPSPQKYWGGGLFGSTSVVDNTKPTADAATRSTTDAAGADPNAVNPDGTLKKIGAESLNGNIGNSLMSLFSGVASLRGLGTNRSLSSSQRSMLGADSAVNTVSQVASQFGPVGKIAGLGLNLVNSIGGSLIGTPKVLKDFKVNDTVASSGGYGGVANSALKTAEDAKTYEGSGLFGKLFGGKKKLVNRANQSNATQSLANDQLTLNNTAFATQAGSTGMLASQNMNKLYGGSAWTNGSIQYGQSGMKFDGVTRQTPNSAEMYRANGVGKTEVDPFGAMLDVPQKAATFALTGKYQKPSQALGIDNKYGAIITDTVLDPVNALFFLKSAKAAKGLQAANDAKWLQLSRPAANGATETAVWNMKPAREGARALGAVNKLKVGSTAQDVQSVYNGLVGSNKEGGTLTTSAKGKTYEEYKKLLGAAASIDFKKIRVKKKDKPKDLPSVVKHEEGGSIKPMSVIVEGKLHAHKHELKDIEELADASITLKGVPVVSQAEGGEITQHAEVERDELILHHACTKKLEALYDIGDEESMVIAGKLLAKELIHNTRDSERGILENA